MVELRLLLLVCLVLLICCSQCSAFAPTSLEAAVAKPKAQKDCVEVLPSEKVSSHEEEEETTTRSLPPVIQQIADERREFQMNLGRAMDTLRRDMPEILRRQPDYSIYHDDIRVVDPSGVQLTGLDKYRSSLAFFQTFLRFWFSPSRSKIQFRMVYDFCRSSIRISWSIVLVPKVPIPGLRPVYVDGISHYTLDAESGKITEHKVEKLVINNRPMTPPYGIWQLLQQDAVAAQPQPVGAGAWA